MSKNIIVTITPSKVVAEQVDTSLQQPIIAREVVPWDTGNLGVALQKSITLYGNVKSVRMVLTDHLYHIAGFVVEKEHVGNRKYIKDKASEFLIEDLNIVRWDYSVKRIEDTKAYIQVFCVTKVFDDELRALESVLKVNIDAILPISVVAYDSFAEKDESFILVYSDDVSKVITIIQDGMLVFSTSFTAKNLIDKFKKVITYAQRYLDFDLIKVVLSGVDQSSIISKKDSFETIVVDISASANLAEMDHLTGNDKKVLNIQLKKNSYGLVSDSLNLVVEEVDDETQNKAYLFFTTLLVVVSLIGVAIGFFVIKLFKHL